MSARKAFLLRIDPALWASLEALARRELRSVNAQIEFILRDALARRGTVPPPVIVPEKDDDGGADE
ncbi:MAG TPA: hypothetical protein PLM09_03970 [Casimicrobiaceae bacterium]|nr:hypothetical protein [Casimicrobiaceae bacterium]